MDLLLIDGSETLPNPVEIFGANLECWIDPQRDVTTGVGGVSDIADQSAHGRDVSQADTAKRPAHVIGGGPGGLDIIRFDGIDNIMHSAAVGAIAQPWNVFAAVKFNSAGNMMITGGVASSNYMGQRVSPEDWWFSAGTSQSSGLPDMDWHHLHQEHLAGNNDSLYLDGALEIGPGNGGGNSWVGLTLGAEDNAPSFFADADMGDVFVVSGALSPAQKTAAYAFLARWIA